MPFSKNQKSVTQNSDSSSGHDSAHLIPRAWLRGAILSFQLVSIFRIKECRIQHHEITHLHNRSVVDTI
jgi:hypothetical protein